MQNILEHSETIHILTQHKNMKTIREHSENNSHMKHHTKNLKTIREHSENHSHINTIQKQSKPDKNTLKTIHI